MTHSIRVFGHDGFIDTYSCVMVDVAGFRQAHNGVDKNILGER